MKHAEVDGFVVQSAGREERGAAEVHVIAIDGAGPWIGWRYVAGGATVVAIAAILSVPSLLRGHRRARVANSSRAATATGAHCIRAPGYGGLGGRVSAFAANNNNSIAPAGPTPGAAWYFMTGTAGGCVTAFALRDAGTPALTASTLLFLVGNPLPRDARRVRNMDRCAVWRSATLKRATGSAYAVATAVPQAGRRAGTAEIRVTSYPAC